MTKVAQEPTGTDNPVDGQFAQQIDKSKKKAGKFTPEMQQSLLKIAISAALFLVAQLLPLPDLAQFGVFLLAYLIVGGEIVLRAVKNITRGQVFDENFLMSVATIGAFCVGEYPEGSYGNAAVSVRQSWFRIMPYIAPVVPLQI